MPSKITMLLENSTKYRVHSSLYFFAAAACKGKNEQSKWCSLTMKRKNRNAGDHSALHSMKSDFCMKHRRYICVRANMHGKQYFDGVHECVKTAALRV